MFEKAELLKFSDHVISCGKIRSRRDFFKTSAWCIGSGMNFIAISKLLICWVSALKKAFLRSELL